MAHVLADHPARGGARHRGPVPHLRKSASNISSTRWAISAKNGLERRRVNTDRTAIPAPAGRSPRYRGGTRRPDRRAESKARRGRPIRCCEARRGRSRSQSTPAQACADASRQAPTRRSGWRSPSVYVDAEGPAEVPAAQRFEQSPEIERPRTSREEPEAGEPTTQRRSSGKQAGPKYIWLSQIRRMLESWPLWWRPKRRATTQAGRANTFELDSAMVAALAATLPVPKTRPKPPPVGPARRIRRGAKAPITRYE